MNIKLDTYNMRELGRPYKKKAPMRKKKSRKKSWSSKATYIETRLAERRF